MEKREFTKEDLGNELDVTTLNLDNLQMNVKETKTVIVEYDEDDKKIVNGYKFIETIGKGSYAKVKLCEKEGNYYAVKVINKFLLKKKRKGYGKNQEGFMTIISMLPDALNEIEILKFIESKGGNGSVIRLKEIINDEEREKIYLVLEYCEKGSIANYKETTQMFYLKDGILYTEEELKGFIRDLAEGL